MNTERIGLDLVERDISVQDRVALGELSLRQEAARKILIIFLAANVLVLTGLAVCFAFDVALLRQTLIKPDERLVTTEVVMTVIGATTVQLGAIMYTIARYLFPDRA